jgi:hypothetical protein
MRPFNIGKRGRIWCRERVRPERHYKLKGGANRETLTMATELTTCAIEVIQSLEETRNSASIISRTSLHGGLLEYAEKIEKELYIST